MLESRLEAGKEVNRALLGGFKNRGDVKMYSRLPDYYYFAGSDLPNEIELSPGIYGGFSKPSRQRLNAIYLTRVLLSNYLSNKRNRNER